VYAWIWRKLPYGVPGKLIGVLLFLGGLVGVLWYGVFPVADRHLPNNDVQVTNPDTDTFTAPPTPSDSVSPTPPGSAPTSLPR
jgi:hypothetical protein